MKNLISATIAGVLILFVASFGYKSGTGKKLLADLDKQEPKLITIEETNLFPEGIEYDSRNERFLLTSLTRGNIGQVKNEEYTPWVTDEALISTVGIHLDEKRDRVLVAAGDMGTSPRSTPITTRKLAAVAAYDLSGKRIFYSDLSHLIPNADHFANDLTVDSEGNAYVTDSYNGVIYKVTKEGKAEIFFEDFSLAPLLPGGIGLNGIDYHSGGFLLVSKMDEAKIIKIPVDNPSGFSEVTIPIPAKLYNPDGLYLKNNGELLVVSNDSGGQNGMLHTFVSSDNWKSAKQKEQFYSPGVFPTTVTVRNGVPYVVYAFLHKIGLDKPQADFSIVRAVTD